MPVMDLPALRTQHAIYTVKSVKSFATWQHQFDVDSNFLSNPATLSPVQFRPKCNTIGGGDYFPQIPSKYIQYSCKVKGILTLAWDIGTK